MVTDADRMEQIQVTPLSLMIEHFKEIKSRAHNLSIEIKRGKYQTLCDSEWPGSGAGWPLGETLDLETM